MNFRQILLISTFLFTTTACVGKEFQMNNRANPYNLEFSSENYSVIQKTSKKIHFNPNPKKVYEVVLKIQGSPMPLFPTREPTVTYQSDCDYTVGLFPLYGLSPMTSYKVPLQRIDENTYKLIYVQDAILDEDYGLKYEGKRQGVCHWKPTGTGVNFTPTGKPQRFSIVVGAVRHPEKLAEQLAKGTEVQYFEKKHVTTAPRPLHSDGTPFNSIGFMGKTRAELAHVKDEDLFTVTVSIKEAGK